MIRMTVRVLSTSTIIRIIASGIQILARIGAYLSALSTVSELALGIQSACTS